MRKKLLLLDLALAVAVAVLAIQVRDRWLEARKRSEVMFHQALKQLPPPPHSAQPPVGTVTAASYGEVALKDLFSADRNPTVIVDPPKEKPMPELPVYYGIMSLTEGATAIMSAKASEPSQGVHFGEKIGEFTLVTVDDDEVTLEWEGKTVTKKISELRPRPDAGAGARVAAARPAPAGPVARAQPPVPQAKGESGPGYEFTPGMAACRPGDPTPNGTVKDGWKKVPVMTPMGSGCHWEKVN